MSDKDQNSTSDFANLLDVLDLKPVTLDPITFGDFLKELSQHPERADTAHGLLVRAVEALGEVDVDKEPPMRQKYLRMLKELGYKLYKAFDLVRGSHRSAHDLMAHVRAAAANGYQLFLALIIKGPPGCGKSMFVDAFKATLEGQIVHSVEGCPVHENPLNLLTLLSDKTLEKIAERLHLTEKDSEANGTPTLKELLAVAGKPCQHCWSLVMENKCEKNPNKALLKLNVVPQRLSTRKFGIATWTPNSSLPSALERGSRGLVDMGELFDGASSPMMGGGTNPSLKILLDATNDRRIPGGGSGPMQGLPAGIKEAAKAVLPASAAKALGADDCEDDGPAAVSANSYLPLDAVLFGQSNEGAWKQFVESLGKDAAKFTRRFYVKTYPYNTSVTEEEMAYHDRIGLMREVPHFDPIALKLLSLLAVISRLKSDGDIDVVSRARIYDGEKLEVKRSTSSSVAGPFGSILGGAASVSDRATASHPDYWTVEDLWRQAGDTEGQSGLDMTVMFNMLSEIIDRALKEKKFERCVSAFEMLTFLRNRVADLEKSDGFTADQKKVLEKCRKDFLMEAPKGSKPGAIESEYRRLLIRQLYELAAPDFERRAEELYQRYKLHANASAVGDKTVEEPVAGRKGRTIKVKIDEVFLDDLDNWIGLKTSTDRNTFRQGLNAEIFKFVRERRVKMNLADDEELKASGEINWKTLPRLADGIRRKLNSETRLRLERLLKSPLELQDETEDDRRLRDEVFKQFGKLGYCEHCRSQALEYFKLNELWAIQS